MQMPWGAHTLLEDKVRLLKQPKLELEHRAAGGGVYLLRGALSLELCWVTHEVTAVNPRMASADQFTDLPVKLCSL